MVVEINSNILRSYRFAVVQSNVRPISLCPIYWNLLDLKLNIDFVKINWPSLYISYINKNTIRWEDKNLTCVFVKKLKINRLILGCIGLSHMHTYMLSCTTLSHHALTITNNKLGNNAKKGDIILELIVEHTRWSAILV